MMTKVPGCRKYLLICLLILSNLCRGGDMPRFDADNRIYCTSLLMQNMKDASLAGFKTSFLFASVKNKFIVKELNEKYIIAGFPLKGNTFALSFKDYGLTTYHERTFSVHYARNIGPGFACGIRMIWHRNSFSDERYFDSDSYSCGFSIVSRVSEKLIVNMQVLNPFRYPNGDFPPSGLLPAVSAGFECFLSSAASINTELVQYRNMKTIAEMDVKIIRKKYFMIIAGIGINPGTCHFGCMLKLNGVIIGIQSCWQPELGFSPESCVLTGRERSRK